MSWERVDNAIRIADAGGGHWSRWCSVRGSDLEDLADAGRLPIALALGRASGGWAGLYVPDRLHGALELLAEELAAGSVRGVSGRTLIRGVPRPMPGLVVLRHAQALELDVRGLMLLLGTPGAATAILEARDESWMNRKRKRR